MMEPSASRSCSEFVRLLVKTTHADQGVSSRKTASDFFVDYSSGKEVRHEHWRAGAACWVSDRGGRWCDLVAALWPRSPLHQR